jgi:hypothetical protein
VDEEYITAIEILSQSGSSTAAVAVHLIKFRWLEFEAMQMLHQEPPIALETFNYHSWRNGIRKRLYDWHTTVPFHEKPAQLAPIEIFDGCLHTMFETLYDTLRKSSTDPSLLYQTSDAATNFVCPRFYADCHADENHAVMMCLTDTQFLQLPLLHLIYIGHLIPR